MSLHVLCPNCQAAFEIAEQHAGKHAKCSKCGTRFKIDAGPTSDGSSGPAASIANDTAPPPVVSAPSEEPHSSKPARSKAVATSSSDGRKRKFRIVAASIAGGLLFGVIVITIARSQPGFQKPVWKLSFDSSINDPSESFILKTWTWQPGDRSFHIRYLFTRPENTGYSAYECPFDEETGKLVPVDEAFLFKIMRPLKAYPDGAAFLFDTLEEAEACVLAARRQPQALMTVRERTKFAEETRARKQKPQAEKAARERARAAAHTSNGLYTP
jgi:predicted Zn finger-like uncharacterized protein